MGRHLLRAWTSPLKAASRTFMIWYPCRGEELFKYLSCEIHWSGSEQRRGTNLRFSLPLSVGQNLPERSPDVKTVQLKG